MYNINLLGKRYTGKTFFEIINLITDYSDNIKNALNIDYMEIIRTLRVNNANIIKLAYYYKNGKTAISIIKK